MYNFNFHSPNTIDEAIKLFNASEEPKFLAGGMTLLASMKQRLIAPTDLIDLRNINDLSEINCNEDIISIGSLCSHSYISKNEISKYNYFPNIIVEELPEFNKVGEEVYKTLEKTAKYVLRALALYLEIDENYFDNYIKNGNSILRPIHYPPITEDPKEAVRAAAHGDINLITLLMGAHGKGLQVQNTRGEWIDAVASEDELMINIGDMLSRHTNNVLKSTVHRVVNPDKELLKKSRYSIPFFMHPISEMKLNVLDSTICEEFPKAYEDITAGEFLEERLIELGLLKK